jgi:hypothetical protein
MFPIFNICTISSLSFEINKFVDTHKSLKRPDDSLKNLHLQILALSLQFLNPIS